MNMQTTCARPGAILSITLLLLALAACGGARSSYRSNVPMKQLKMDKSKDYATEEAREAEMAPAAAGAQDGKTAMQPHNTEAYDRIYENSFQKASQSPLSTFSIDVDTASYANSRRFLLSGKRPPRDAVRVEEFINYFDYKYSEPGGDHPFSVTTELSDCPWQEGHQLLLVGLKGKSIAAESLPPRNLTFLLDVSGSMTDSNKLPLLKKALQLLLPELTEKDSISIVVYAGASGLVLPPTNGTQKSRIASALDDLEAGGSTNGGQGIELAYQVARQNFNKSGINRVILATDGDFNVGTTSQGDLIRLIEKERESGIFLTVLGFGTGNVKDSTMEKLADKGNGNYAYIDSIMEARKVLVKEAGSTLITIAKDVKIQIEFNPAVVAGYRLIGYENRLLNAEDFNNDKKDAGEIGAGHTVTALYQIVPVGKDVPGSSVDPLKYQSAGKPPGNPSEAAHIKIRYKKPEGNASILLSSGIAAKKQLAGENMRFASAVAAFGLLLRDSEFKGQASFEMVKSIAASARNSDPNGYRSEFVRLVELAKDLKI